MLGCIGLPGNLEGTRRGELGLALDPGDLVLLEQESMPLVLAPTTSALRACMRAMSIFTSPTEMPWS